MQILEVGIPVLGEQVSVGVGDWSGWAAIRNANV